MTGAALHLSAARRPAERSCLRRLAAARRVPVFQTPGTRRETAIAGMWLFLATEMLFFGALFLTWISAATGTRPASMPARSRPSCRSARSTPCILLTSSLVYAPGLAFIEAGNTPPADPVLRHRRWLLGLAFLVLKFGVEWHDDFARASVSRGPIRASRARWRGGARLFFVFYFIGTALHGLHMIGGLVTGRLDHLARRGAAEFSRRLQHAGRRWSASTGASSTSSGSCSIR